MATIKGVWVFNDTIDVATAFSYSLDFSSNGTDYSEISVKAISGGAPIPIHYGNMLKYGLDNAYYVDYGGGSYVSGWQNEAYKTITINTEPTDEAFISWLTANATQQTDTPTDAVTIEYNGAVIASLKAGQTATLPCKDKPMHTDVVVTVPEGLGGADVPEWDGSYTISGGTISFTIDGVSYEAEEGMTWAEWCDSSYNTGGFTANNSTNRIMSSSGREVWYSANPAYPTNIITSDGVYSTVGSGGSGN